VSSRNCAVTRKVEPVLNFLEKVVKRLQSIEQLPKQGRFPAFHWKTGLAENESRRLKVVAEPR
jgi:hypothetical protein